MIRIHLTAEDLLRTRFVSHPAPLTEVELLRSAPAPFVAAELQRLSGSRSSLAWVRLLAAQEHQTCYELDLPLRSAIRHLIENDWPRILSGFLSELTWRSRLVAEFGVQAALSTLHPGISLEGTILRVATPAQRDLHPGGAGLTLMPSTLWSGRPLVAMPPGRSVMIVYPVTQPPPADGTVKDPIAELLGQTRAAILRLTFTERTTSDLARELGVSAPTVSGHTKALRAAGLIVTTRAGKAVHHAVTPLGHRLAAGRQCLPGSA